MFYNFNGIILNIAWRVWLISAGDAAEIMPSARRSNQLA